jgi:mono/diheme cytochrome c family protein
MASFSRFTVSVGLLMSAWLLGAGLMFGQSKDPEKPLIGSIRGVDLFVSYCASCHGRDGKGNGPMALLLKVQPSDLTRISIRNQGTFPVAKVQRIIEGSDQPGTSSSTTGGHGSREMPVWGPIFSRITVTPAGQDADLGRVRIDNLARYLRSIQVMP